MGSMVGFGMGEGGEGGGGVVEGEVGVAGGVEVGWAGLAGGVGVKARVEVVALGREGFGGQSPLP